MKDLFLTGPSGAGKTTILMRALREAGIIPAGFAVKRCYRNCSIESMVIVDLLTGTRA